MREDLKLLRELELQMAKETAERLQSVGQLAEIMRLAMQELGERPLPPHVGRRAAQSRNGD